MAQPRKEMPRTPGLRSKGVPSVISKPSLAWRERAPARGAGARQEEASGGRSGGAC